MLKDRLHKTGSLSSLAGRTAPLNLHINFDCWSFPAVVRWRWWSGVLSFCDPSWHCMWHAIDTCRLSESYQKHVLSEY